MQLKRGSPVHLLFGATATLLVVLLITQAQVHVSAHAALERSNPEADAVVTDENGEEDTGSFSFTLQVIGASPVASPVASPGTSHPATLSQVAG